MTEKETNPYGISKKSVSGLSFETFNRYQKALFRHMKESNITQRKEQERTQQMFGQMMSIIAKQSKTIDGATNKDNKSSLPYLLKQGFQGVSSGVYDMNKSLDALILTLKRQEIERKVLNDREVREKTRQAQKIMTRKRQRLRDKEAPGMLLKGLFTSQMAPAWSQWIANKLGIRSFETTRENLQEREQLEVDVAKTKIDIARQEKRRELMGITGEDIAGLAGKKTETGEGLKKSLDKLADVADMFRQAIQRFGGEQVITEPMLTITKEERIEEGYKKGMKFMEGLPTKTAVQFPFRPPPEEGSIRVSPLPPPTGGRGGEKITSKNIPDAILTGNRRPKQIKEDVFSDITPFRATSDLMKKIESEGALPINFTPKTEETLGKTIGDHVEDGVINAFKKMEKGKTYGETGGEEELGVLSPEAQVSEGPIKKMAESLGIGIKETVASVPIFGDIFTGLGKHQHGGTVSPTAGTGFSSFRMNPKEGINVPYDNTAIAVPNNMVGLNIVPETDMKKLAALKMNAAGPENPNIALEGILKELLKTNQKANELLEQIAEGQASTEDQIPFTPPTVASPGKNMTSRKGTGFGLTPIKVL